MELHQVTSGNPLPSKELASRRSILLFQTGFCTSSTPTPPFGLGSPRSVCLDDSDFCRSHPAFTLKVAPASRLMSGQHVMHRADFTCQLLSSLTCDQILPRLALPSRKRGRCQAGSGRSRARAENRSPEGTNTAKGGAASPVPSSRPRLCLASLPGEQLSGREDGGAGGACAPGKR